MRKSIVIYCLSVAMIFISCGSNEDASNKDDHQNSNLTSESDPDTSDLSVDELIDSNVIDSNNELFSKYFGEKLIAKIDNYMSTYESLQTAKEFEKCYDQGKDLFKDLFDAYYNPQTEYMKKLKKDNENEYGFYDPVNILDNEFFDMTGKMGPIVFTCVAECTEIDFTYDQEKLLEKAKLTEGNDDELFLEYATEIYGPNWTSGSFEWPVWYVQTWDYGGSSKIGDGTLKKYIKKHQELESKLNLFSVKMKYIKDHMLEELSHVGSYMKSKEMVLKEYDEILEMDFFNEEEKTKIRDARAKLEGETEDYIQFNCESGDCSYG
ncbi:hypothetical protein K6119_10105 [Paracrocinitomix mangrovi]|uniref:hypothetical protein n=1 Tax=Paracrocinitomix mangrovi TaxID=2862509 RepID=UPI001C8D9D16|nr:hypothetical protein [Paracrocinitomix mangrovi]UKN00089.1 hypothetical protein K6119_10105 [Paracrocinitomix mangrovi]